MLTGLGQELRAARKLRNLSLQDVAGPAKISIAYLQKLENGVVASPSPRVLQRLASTLDVSYGRLMELAGYLMPESAWSPKSSRIPTALPDEDLSEAEWKAVAAFVQYLKAQRDQKV